MNRFLYLIAFVVPFMILVHVSAKSHNQGSLFPDPPLKYSSYNHTEYTLSPWRGRNVAVLTKSKQLDHTTMERLLAGIDSAYDYYYNMTGKKPENHFTYKGRLLIAEVSSSTCNGAACGWPGSTGIELVNDTFKILYTRVKANYTFDQVVFYELGRNFWYYQPQLGKVHPFSTGFAILNRFLSMEAAGLKGAPFKPDMPFDEFKRSILKDLLDIYLADDTLSWRNTLAINMAPSNPNGWGDADLAAAMLNVINVDAGPNGLRTFWRTLRTLPAAKTDVEAMGNFLCAGKTATGHDYRDLLRDNSLPMPSREACMSK